MTDGASETTARVRRLLPATLSTGEAARVVAFDGTTFEARSPRPFAPGARAVFHVESGDTPIVVDLKCHGSKRVDDGVFHVRGRVISLPREARERLVEALGGPQRQGTPSK